MMLHPRWALARGELASKPSCAQWPLLGQTGHCSTAHHCRPCLATVASMPSVDLPWQRLQQTPPGAQLGGCAWAVHRCAASAPREVQGRCGAQPNNSVKCNDTFKCIETCSHCTHVRAASISTAIVLAANCSAELKDGRCDYTSALQSSATPRSTQCSARCSLLGSWAVNTQPSAPRVLYV